ncbi:50S ribosomal protein L28 [Patescibacteria group bacterium]
MAYACDMCEKGSDFGHLVSHAKNRTKTLRRPNLHAARILVEGKKVKVKLCTKCLRQVERPHKVAMEEKASKKEEK